MKRFFALVFVVALAMPMFAFDGAANFKAKCAGCHGADGSKAMPAMGVKPINVAGTTGKSVADLTAVVTKGQGKMPAFAGKLTDPEIKEVATFVKGLK
jgi:mono/diheme cytochrome c family protein